MAADVGQASACAGLQSRWRDSYERCGRRAKAPPQAEARLKPAPHGLAAPTLARKSEVIPAPALSPVRAAISTYRQPKRRPRLVTAALEILRIMNTRQLEVLFPIGLLFEERRGAVANFHPAGGLILEDPRLFHVSQILALRYRAGAEGPVFDGSEKRGLASGLNSRAHQV